MAAFAEGVTPIAGGAVAVPLTKLARLARLAWMCQPYARPALRLRFPGKAVALKRVEGAGIKKQGREVTVTFADNGQAAEALPAMVALGKQLTQAPEGTVLELDLEPIKRSPRNEGVHRYRAIVERGAWQVGESYPQVSREVLTEALALAEAMESGRRLEARDEEEAKAIEARVLSSCGDMLGGNALQRSGAEVALARRDPTLFDHVVNRVFWMRYAKTWPLRDGDK